MAYKADIENPEDAVPPAELADPPYTAAAPKQRRFGKGLGKGLGKRLSGWRGLAIGIGLGATIAIVGGAADPGFVRSSHSNSEHLGARAKRLGGNGPSEPD